MTEYVSVPKALLQEVLALAEGDNFAVENEYCCSSEQAEDYQAEREKIRELRRIAGIPEDG
jgi:hypothetical protein